MRAEWMMLYALLTAAPSMADNATPDAAPALEMLEFLGSWETAKGETVDPAQFADTGLADTTPETDKPKPSPRMSEDMRHDQHE